MSNPTDQGEANIQLLARINNQLRDAVRVSFPSAFEQYVTIQMPGTIIDTRLGGTYLPETPRTTADIRNMIMCNEAMLVDSMIPLDKMMLGPTGKSVTRSYMSALDMLVPRKTDIGAIDVDAEFSGEASSKYGQAMRFLRSKESILTPSSEVKGSRLREVKGKMLEQGVQGTVVDRYVEKQLAWSRARGNWDAVRSEALEARESRAELQSAALFSQRQKELKRAQGELHARWMDWVVNGDKFRVEYCFAVVDRDSIMARIERAREATRDAMLTSIDGTEWAQITLEPKNWAEICREKALDWKTRNPANPAHLQMRLDSLKRMKLAYEVYKDQLDNRSQPSAPSRQWPEIKAAYETVKGNLDNEEKGDRNPEKLKLLRKSLAENEKLYFAMSNVEKATGELLELNKALEALRINKASEQDINNQVDAIAKKKDDIIRLNNKAYIIEKTGSSTESAKIREALEEIYQYEKDEREAQNEKKSDLAQIAHNNLEAAKAKLRTATTELQAIETKGAVLNLEVNGIEAMKSSMTGHLRSLQMDIDDVQTKLASTGGGLSNAPRAIIGVNKDNSLITANESEITLSGPGNTTTPEQTADVWTNISFSVGSSSSSNSTQETNISGSANLQVGNWWASVKASTSFSSSSKKFEKSMSECSVQGSFSAMVVNIKRPWLHGDLFQDFDVDIPDGTKLSPGAATVKRWVDHGDTETESNKRTEYGKFPAYPTSFIVAADTVLEFKSTQSNSQEMMSALSTDSSIQASYGPWGLKGGASAKTDDKKSSSNMEVKDGSLRISFQAPQIIGWVSEILPQLPRGKDGTGAPIFGGLTGPPNMAFRV